MSKLFDWFAGKLIERAQRAPYFHIQHANGSPYMDRFWLMPRWALVRRRAGGFDRRFKWLPAIRIHHIRSSDWDRHLHDHPGWSCSLLLRNRYLEVTPRHQAQSPEYDQLRGGVWERWRYAGEVVLRSAKARHRLVIPAGESCWSMFIIGPKTKEWGFHTPDGWVHHQDYFVDRSPK